MKQIKEENHVDVKLLVSSPVVRNTIFSKHKTTICNIFHQMLLSRVLSMQMLTKLHMATLIILRLKRKTLLMTRTIIITNSIFKITHLLIALTLSPTEHLA